MTNDSGVRPKLKPIILKDHGHMGGTEMVSPYAPDPWKQSPAEKLRADKLVLERRGRTSND